MKKVFIFGGTHGNEWTGITIVKYYGDILKKKFPELDLHFVLANPDAYQMNKRFKDEDLNRAFQYLNEKRETSEHKRAHELKQMIDEEPCFIIDLHTTTSNMGKTLILPQYNPIIFKISEAIANAFADARIIGSPDPNKKFLASQTNYGLMIEVGPVANGIIDPVILKETLLLLETILRQITLVSMGSTGSFEFYEEIADIYYPQDQNGEITAFIHSKFQGKDFVPVIGEYAAFENFMGETLHQVASETLYPIFINEAAYYPTKLAYSLCRKRNLTF